MPEFQFDSFSDFMAMSGYGFYVWSSYAVFAVVIGWNLLQPRIERRRIIRMLKARTQREARWQDVKPETGEQS